jgi:TRAP-type C4-dicarboxylate transport system substrate-binding protein
MKMQRAEAVDEDTKLAKKMAESGVILTTLTPDQLEAFKQGSASVYQDFKKKIGEDFVSLIEQEVKRLTK